MTLISCFTTESEDVKLRRHFKNHKSNNFHFSACSLEEKSNDNDDANKFSAPCVCYACGKVAVKCNEDNHAMPSSRMSASCDTVLSSNHKPSRKKTNIRNFFHRIFGISSKSEGPGKNTNSPDNFRKETCPKLASNGESTSDLTSAPVQKNKSSHSKSSSQLADVISEDCPRPKEICERNPGIRNETFKTEPRLRSKSDSTATFHNPQYVHPSNERHSDPIIVEPRHMARFENASFRQAVGSKRPSIELLTRDGTLKLFSSSTLTLIDDTGNSDSQRIAAHLGFGFPTDRIEHDESRSGSDDVFFSNDNLSSISDTNYRNIQTGTERNAYFRARNFANPVNYSTDTRMKTKPTLENQMYSNNESNGKVSYSKGLPQFDQKPYIYSSIKNTADNICPMPLPSNDNKNLPSCSALERCQCKTINYFRENVSNNSVYKPGVYIQSYEIGDEEYNSSYEPQYYSSHFKQTSKYDESDDSSSVYHKPVLRNFAGIPNTAAKMTNMEQNSTLDRFNGLSVKTKNGSLDAQTKCNRARTLKRIKQRGIQNSRMGNYHTLPRIGNESGTREAQGTFQNPNDQRENVENIPTHNQYYCPKDESNLVLRKKRQTSQSEFENVYCGRKLVNRKSDSESNVDVQTAPSEIRKSLSDFSNKTCSSRYIDLGAPLLQQNFNRTFESEMALHATEEKYVTYYNFIDGPLVDDYSPYKVKARLHPIGCESSPE